MLLAPALGTLGLGALGILGLGTLGTLGPLGLGALSTLRGTFFCSVTLRLLKLAFVPFQPSLPLRVFLLPFKAFEVSLCAFVPFLGCPCTCSWLPLY